MLLIVLRAADRCLSVLNHKTKGKTRKKVKEEVSSLFGHSRLGHSRQSTSKTKCEWKHKFICLASHEQVRIPTTDWEKDALLEAGLGEKEIEFNDLNISADEFRDLLYEHFPRLKDGGGFKFYKCIANSRVLEVLSATTMSSPDALRARVGKARTYIRPLQRDLDMTAVVTIPGGVSNLMGRG